MRATPDTGQIRIVFNELKRFASAGFNHTSHSLARTKKARIIDNSAMHLGLLIYASVQSEALQEHHGNFSGSFPFSLKGCFFISANVAVTPESLYLNMEAKFLFQRSGDSQPSAPFQIKLVSAVKVCYRLRTKTHKPSSLPQTAHL